MSKMDSHWGDSIWFLGHNSTPSFISCCVFWEDVWVAPAFIPQSLAHSCCCCWYSSMSNQWTNSWLPPHIPFSLRICLVVLYKRPNLPHLQNGTLFVFYVDNDDCKTCPHPHLWAGELNAHIFDWSFSCLKQANHSKVLCSSHNIAIKSSFDHVTHYQCKFRKF